MRINERRGCGQRWPVLRACYWSGELTAALFGREAGQYAALLLGSSMLYLLIGHISTLDMGVTFPLTWASGHERFFAL